LNSAVVQRAPSRVTRAGRYAIALLFGAAAALAGFYVWAKQPDFAGEQRALALEFSRLLVARELSAAHNLTVKSAAVGRTLEEFAARVERNGCGGSSDRTMGRTMGIAYTYPPQTNGNLLRRRLAGRQAEQTPLSVEITGGCPFEVRVARKLSGGWAVVYFQTHAS
jgi:hypothetical protein